MPILARPVIREIAFSPAHSVIGDRREQSLQLRLSLPLQTTVVPLVARGSRLATFTRATTATFTDFEGLVKAVLSGEVRFDGARRVENLVVDSETLTAGAGWTLSNSTSVVGATDPDGGSTAYTLTATGADGEIKDAVTISADEQTAVMSWFVRRVSGTGNVQIINADGGWQTITITSSWQRMSVKDANVTTTAGWTGIRAQTSGDVIEIWHPQFETTSGQAITAPSEFVSVGALSSPFHGAMVDGVQYFKYANGNTVSSGVVTEAQSADFDATDSFNTALGPFGYRAEGQRQNINIWSRDLTSWTPTGTSVAAFDAVGIDGHISATTLTDDDGAAFEFVSMSAVIPNDGNVVSVEHRILKDSDTSRFPEFVALLSGGTLQQLLTQINTSTGAKNDRVSTGTTTSEVVDGGLWWILKMTVQNNTSGNTALTMTDYPARTTTFGTTEVAATGSIIVGHVQAELDTTFNSSPILTEGSAITRNADVLTYDDAGNILDVAGTAFAMVSTDWSVADINGRVIARDPSGLAIFTNSGQADTINRINDGTNNSQSLAGTSRFNSPQKTASTWGASLTAYSPGTLIADASPGSYVGTMGTGDIAIGSNNIGNSQWFGNISFVQIFSKELNTAQVGALPQ